MNAMLRESLLDAARKARHMQKANALAYETLHNVDTEYGRAIRTLILAHCAAAEVYERALAKAEAKP